MPTADGNSPEDASCFSSVPGKTLSFLLRRLCLPISLELAESAIEKPHKLAYKPPILIGVAFPNLIYVPIIKDLEREGIRGWEERREG